MANPMSIDNLLNETGPEEQRVSDDSETSTVGADESRGPSQNTIHFPLIEPARLPMGLPPVQATLESYSPGHAYFIPSPSTSPDPYRRRRSGGEGNTRREFRPIYALEEEYFIWYHRIDLQLDWRKVRECYNRQFPYRQRRGFQGIQCKYYRCCVRHNIPPVRDRSKIAANERVFGIRQKLPHMWYPWMREPPRYFPRIVKL